MKKIDALLNKIALFERLAVYGDRKSFLQALSQQLDYIDPTTGKKMTFDPSKVPVPAKSTPSKLDEIPSPRPEAPEAPPIPVEQLPKAPPVVKSPGGIPYDASVEQVQKYLNQVMGRQLPPVTVDGFLGTETTNRVKQWGLANKLHLDLATLIDMLKVKAGGADTASQIKPGPYLSSKYK